MLYAFSGWLPIMNLGMEVNGLIWVLLPVFVAAGSALLSYSIMHARMEVAIARERATLAEANAKIETHKITLEERLRATAEETKRKALNEFMEDFRVEERHYVRENNSPAARRKTMVMQERLYFRNIPLSNWVEHEMLVEDTSHLLEEAVSDLSVFTPKALKQGRKDEPSYSGRLLS